MLADIIRTFSAGNIPIYFKIIEEKHSKEKRDQITFVSVVGLIGIYTLFFSLVDTDAIDGNYRPFITGTVIFAPLIILTLAFKAIGVLKYLVIGEIVFHEESAHLTIVGESFVFRYDQIASVQSKPGLPDSIIELSDNKKTYQSINITFQLKNGEKFSINTLKFMKLKEEHQSEFRSIPPTLEKVLKAIYPRYKSYA